MFNKGERNQLNVTLMAKRNIEDNDNSRVNYVNNNWIKNNNKKVRTGNIWTPLESNGVVTTKSLNIDSQDVNMNPDEEEEEDAFNDGMDYYISQITQDILQPQLDISANHLQPISRAPDPNTSSVKSAEDVVMNTNSDQSHQSSNSSDANEGRLKILESRCNKLNSEVTKLKTQNIKSQHKIIQLEKENNNKITKVTGNYESVITFERNEKVFQTQLMVQLQSALRQFAPNAPILQTTTEYLNQRKKAHQQDFSQTKIQEFYGPLSFHSGLPSNSMSSLNTPLSVGDVLVPESQSGSGITIGGKRPKLSASFPSQILSTQMMSVDCTMNSAVNSVEACPPGSSIEQSVPEADGSQMSQTQSLRIIWNACRSVLEHKFYADRELLNPFLFESQKQFDDQWIRDKQELNDFTTHLNQLSDELGLNIQPVLSGVHSIV